MTFYNVFPDSDCEPRVLARDDQAWNRMQRARRETQHIKPGIERFYKVVTLQVELINQQAFL